MLALVACLAAPAARATAPEEVSATQESPCPEGAERVGAKPPEGDRTGCVLRTDDGAVLHGPQATWYPNGFKRQETNFRGGKPHGLKLDWGIRGNLMQKWEYQDGQLHGEHVIYSPAGTVMRRSTYVAGSRVESEEPKPRPARPAPAKPKPRPETAQTSPPPAKPASRPARGAFSCEIFADALEQRLAADRKYFEGLTRGQLRMVHSPGRLVARLVLGGDAPAETRIQEHYRYRLEATNELGFAQNDPVLENVKEREAGMRGVAGVLEDRMVELLGQWKELMRDSPPADPSMPSSPAPATPSEVVLHEADVQKVAGILIPSRLSYSLRVDGNRSEIRLQNCRSAK